MISQTISQLAQYLDGEVRGDGNCHVSGIAPLQHAKAGQISFLDNPQYRKYLSETKASVVILAADFVDACPTNAIIVANPYYAYACVARLFNNKPIPRSGCHPSSVIDDAAVIDASASIGPHCVIAANAKIGKNVIIGAGCNIGENSVIDDDSRLWPNVTVYYGVSIGKRAIIHAGAVLGADGFGFAKHEGRWTKITQLGSLIIGDDVEIGANTTIDRGALENTLIGNDVKLDNLIQVGHNVQIGDHTAIAGCVAIAGSTKIGKHCLIGGAVGIAGHLEITDNVSIVGKSSVAGSIKESGVYSSGTSVQPHRLWIKNVIRLQHLDKMYRRVSSIEKALMKQQPQDDSNV